METTNGHTTNANLTRFRAIYQRPNPDTGGDQGLVDEWWGDIQGRDVTGYFPGARDQPHPARDRVFTIALTSPVWVTFLIILALKAF